ncbi:hypothetical protein MPER_01855 [Moniliophthora perniciosa FA553]|nr:hypothetical protein MPER_01855 [Moniliophthora perniciosa FA553]
MDCWTNELWMNTSSGALFSGPDGPRAPVLWSHADKPIVVPTTVDMLKDDTCFKFFLNFGSSVDTMIMQCAQWKHEYTYLDNLSRATAEDHQSKDSDHWKLATHPYLGDLWYNPPDHLPMNVIGSLRFDTVYSSFKWRLLRGGPGACSFMEMEGDARD